MPGFVKEFKEFISRGSVIDLAVGIVIGAAFTTVINSFVRDVLTAIIGALFGKPNFDSLSVVVGQGVIHYGRFITAVINFVLIGFALFLIVKAVNRLRRKDDKASEPTEKDLLVEIRDTLRAGCPTDQGPVSTAGK